MNAKVLAITTNKGGVLKSSTTSSLAGLWGSQGKRVLIIDMDNQGNSAISFGLNPDNFENTIYDVLVDGMAAENTLVKAWENVDLIPSNDDTIFIENDLKENGRMNGKNDFLFLKNAVNHLRRYYDIILVDSPPTMGTIQGNILAFVDEIIIPFQPEPFSQRSLIKIVHAVEDMKAEINPNLKILGILPTLVDNRAIIHSEIITECRQLALQKDWHMFDTTIPRSIRFVSELRKHGLPATITNPKHKVVQNYFELAKEIEEIWEEKKVTV